MIKDNVIPVCWYCIFSSIRVSMYNISPYMCRKACKKVRVRFQRELESQMTSQYVIYFRQRLAHVFWKSCTSIFEIFIWTVLWNFNKNHIPQISKLSGINCLNCFSSIIKFLFHLWCNLKLKFKILMWVPCSSLEQRQNKAGSMVLYVHGTQLW